MVRGLRCLLTPHPTHLGSPLGCPTDCWDWQLATAMESDNSYSASACVGMAITGVIPLLVTLFLLSQQILNGSMSFNLVVPKDTYFMTCDHTENVLLGRKSSF